MLFFRPATPADHPALLALINGAYRARDSWTHECDLLDGQRITPEGLADLPGVIETAWQGGQLVGCIHIEANHLGMLSVCPSCQTGGIGRQLLDRAHHLTRQQGYTQATLTVLRQRPELLAYYQRRGYQLTGRSFPFPVHEQVGRPKRDDLELLELRFRL